MIRPGKKNRRIKGRRFPWAFVAVPLLVVLLAVIFFFPHKTDVSRKDSVPPKVEPPLPEVKESLPPSTAPRLALIMDDVGYRTDWLRELSGFGRITLSILPGSPHAREAALMARQQGLEVMLHLPMEPKGGERVRLEKETILVGMKAERVHAIVQDGLKRVPYARGVNNHMGSKATEDPEVMQALIEDLGKEGLYFIDSQTSRRSLGPAMAKKAGIASARNDRFIDHVKELPAIKKSIRSAVEMARKEGKAVVIGHPHPLTVQALRELLPAMEKEGVQLVFASEVVR